MMNGRTMGVTPPRVMTIGGTDSSGGAGSATDLYTFAACGVHDLAWRNLRAARIRTNPDGRP